VRIVETIENVQDITQILALWRQHLRGWMLPVCPDRCPIPRTFWRSLHSAGTLPDCRPISYTTHMMFIRTLFPVIIMSLMTVFK
jgi:hypothetical protein